MPPADPAFLLNGWAVAVFLMLVITVGIPVAFAKWVDPRSTVEAERRRSDMLQQAVNNGLEANRTTADAVLKLLPLAETTVSILGDMQDERDEARRRGLIEPHEQGPSERAHR